jgi:hypothetical protein
MATGTDNVDRSVSRQLVEPQRYHSQRNQLGARDVALVVFTGLANVDDEGTTAVLLCKQLDLHLLFLH